MRHRDVMIAESQQSSERHLLLKGPIEAHELIDMIHLRSLTRRVPECTGLLWSDPSIRVKCHP